MAAAASASASDRVTNMYDPALKPRLLRTLLKQQIPDEKRGLQNPLDLAHVVTLIKTHDLLSENVVEGDGNKKLGEKWKGEVVKWVERVLGLVSSDAPDKCWAGISLLGVTCQECSTERFLALFSVWFHKLLSHLQPPSDSYFVKVASCVSLSDLLTRLGELSNVKKEGTSLAGKLVQPVLKLLDEGNSNAEGVIQLLRAILSFFPSSLQRHYDSAEAAIVSKVMSGKCSLATMKKLGHCLALLPKSKGDPDSWSLMMQKMLIATNVLLNEAFQGLEEDTKSNEIMRLLVPPGKDPPPPLGGKVMLEISSETTKRSQQCLMSNISALMLCCCRMLSVSYSFQITVPVRPILAIIGRVLSVDGSLPSAMYFFTTTAQHEIVCSELPLLHLNSLELLSEIVKKARSQLLPHAPQIARLLTEYIRRCSLPEHRIKIYSIMKSLMTSMGVGMATYLSQEVINSTFVDLDSVGSDAKSSLKASPMPSKKKRKHETMILPLEEQSERVCSRKNPASVSLKIAALEALETLLTVGGASRSEKWRPGVDRLLITVAIDACKGGWSHEETDVFLGNKLDLNWSDFQLAALRALLASLLSHSRVRPPYLSHGLELFRRGMQETGTELAEYCSHALLALEVLIHPRALPLMDSESAMDYSGNMYSASQKNRLDDPESEDELYDRWLKIGDNRDVPAVDSGKNASDVEKPFTTFGDTSSNSLLPNEGSVKEGKRKGILVEAQEIQDGVNKIEHTVRPGDSTVAFSGYKSTGGSGMTSGSGAIEVMDTEMATEKNVPVIGRLTEKGKEISIEALEVQLREKRTEETLRHEDHAVFGGPVDTEKALKNNVSTTISVFEKTSSYGMEFAVSDDQLMDEVPDIVDVEPDSDDSDED